MQFRKHTELAGATLAKISSGQRCAVRGRYGTVVHVFHKQSGRRTQAFTHDLYVGEMPILDGQSALKVLLDDGHTVWVVFPHPDLQVFGRVAKGLLDSSHMRQDDKVAPIRTYWALQLLASTSWAQVAMCCDVLVLSLKPPSSRAQRGAKPRKRSWDNLDVPPRVGMLVNCVSNGEFCYANIDAIESEKGQVRLVVKKTGEDLGWRDYPSAQMCVAPTCRRVNF